MTSKAGIYARRDVFSSSGRRAKDRCKIPHQRGYKIIQTNWTCPAGEGVDIVAQDGDNVVLVEGKDKTHLEQRRQHHA